MSVDRWVQPHAPEHGEHLSGMAAAAQDNKYMGGGILWAIFGEMSILRDCKSADELLIGLVV